MRGCLLWVVALAMAAAPVAAQPAAGASRLLTVAPPAFLETCRADIDRARASADRFRSMEPGGEPLSALDEYDAAFARLNDAASRASLARNVHPDRGDARRGVAVRERGRQANDGAVARPAPSTSAHAGLDVSTADAATRYYVERTLRDFRRAGVDQATRPRARGSRRCAKSWSGSASSSANNIAGDVRTVELDRRGPRRPARRLQARARGRARTARSTSRPTTPTTSRS